MAIQNRTGAQRALVPAGTYGNLTRAHYKATVNAAPVNDVVYLGRIPAGCKVSGARFSTAGLGASVTLDLGWDDEQGNAVPQGFAAAQNGAGAQFAILDKAPVDFTKETFITAKINGAAATGTIEFAVDYVYSNL